MLGWEEGNLVNKVSKDTIVYSWLSEEAAINSAKLGYDVILQPGQSTYLDMAQDNNTSELGVHSANTITLEKAYHYEPLAQLHPDDPVKKRILGMQAAVWTERITSPDTLDYMMFPRLTALAETAWSTNNNKDYCAFLSRLKRHLCLLDRQCVKYKHPWPTGQGLQGVQYQTQRQY
jgi:hexosaminidase